MRINDKRPVRVVIICLIVIALALSFPWLALEVFGKNTNGEVESVVSEKGSARGSVLYEENINYWFYANGSLYKGTDKMKALAVIKVCGSSKMAQLRQQSSVQIRYCRFLPYVSRIECVEE